MVALITNLEGLNIDKISKQKDLRDVVSDLLELTRRLPLKDSKLLIEKISLKSKQLGDIKSQVIINYVKHLQIFGLLKRNGEILELANEINILSEKIDYKEGEDLKADVLVELLPEIKLPDFEKIEIEIPKEELKIDDYDENKQINAVLEANKKQVPLKDRAIRDNDIVLLKYQSKIIQTKKMCPRKTENFNVNKEEKFEIMDLYDEIVGKNLGDKVVFKRKYPKNYVKKIWAEKNMEHYVEIDAIYEFKKPLLNKEFLSSIRQRILLLAFVLPLYLLSLK